MCSSVLADQIVKEVVFPRTSCHLRTDLCIAPLRRIARRRGGEIKSLRKIQTRSDILGLCSPYSRYTYLAYPTGLARLPCRTLPFAITPPCRVSLPRAPLCQSSPILNLFNSFQPPRNHLNSAYRNYQRAPLRPRNYLEKPHRASASDQYVPSDPSSTTLFKGA